MRELKEIKFLSRSQFSITHSELLTQQYIYLYEQAYFRIKLSRTNHSSLEIKNIFPLP